MTNIKPIKSSSSKKPVAEALPQFRHELVFSVMDDLKLYGAEALEKEFSERQYDPYTLYKQKLAHQSTSTFESEIAKLKVTSA